MKNWNSSGPESQHHVCEAFRNGDWIVYRCPQCDYEMRDNWRTGEMRVQNAKRDIRHSGNYVPTEYSDAFGNLN